MPSAGKLIENSSNLSASRERRRTAFALEVGLLLEKTAGDDAEHVIVTLLKDPDSSVRWFATRVLGEMKSEVASKYLARMLKDPSDEVRCEAAEILEELHPKEAISDLTEALGDKNFLVRSRAASALKKIEAANTSDYQPLVKSEKSQVHEPTHRTSVAVDKQESVNKKVVDTPLVKDEKPQVREPTHTASITVDEQEPVKRKVLDKLFHRSLLIGTLQILLSAFFFGCIGVFVKIAYSQGIDSITVLAFRFIIATIALWIYFSIFGTQFLKCNRQELLILAVFGILGYGSMSTLMFLSLERIPASLMAMIFYTHPALIVVLTRIFYKEPINSSKVVALLLTLSGCAFILQVSFNNVNRTSGILLALGTSVVYAIYLTSGQRVLKKIRPQTVTIYVITYLAVVFSIYRNPFAVISAGVISSKGWLAISALAIFSTCFAILLLFSGIEKIGAARASLISTIEPLVAVLIAYLFLGEEISFTQLSGGGLILLGIIVIELSSANKTVTQN
jgi:drug/metabolite transporter (DMT)-like permease